MNPLVVMGSAPCLFDDLARMDGRDCDFLAVNRAGVMFTGNIWAWATYHPAALVQEDWPGMRASRGGNSDFLLVLHERNCWADKICGQVEYFTGPGITGSSTLFGILLGLSRGYEDVIVAGAPLDGEYAHFQDGWRAVKKQLRGRVRSLSGWTKTYLEALNAA